jgi:hypothetical protein
MGAVPTPVTGARTLPNVAMTLAATRLTPDVGARLRSLSGRVRSAHRAAIYLDAGSPRSLLVVALDDVGGVPGGILVTGIVDLRDTGIRPEMAVVPSTRGVSIPAAAIEIDVTNAISWSPALPPAARLRPSPELDRTSLL